MTYFKISIVLFLISICLLLIGLFVEKINYGFIIAGMIVNYIGVAMMITGAIKGLKKLIKVVLQSGAFAE